MRSYVYALLCLACFVGGAYVWRLKNGSWTLAARDDQKASVATGANEMGTLATAAATSKNAVTDLSAPNDVVVEVGRERITQADIDWEYNLVTQGIVDKESLTPIPDLGARYHEELGALRKSLIGSVVERKLLFAFVQQDHDFGFDNPGRFTACLSEWQKSVQQSVPTVQTDANKQRLKSRLCERAILEQYLAERLFAGIKVEDSEVLEYYKNHLAEFNQPEQVDLRQILLANEGEARRWRAQVNARNFAELARLHSIAPEAKVGGRLGPFAKDRVPAVFEIAFHMKRGEISDVLKSNYGYHIIILLDKTPKHELSLDQARPKIVARLTTVRREAEYSKWVERALAAINVTAPHAL